MDSTRIIALLILSLGAACGGAAQSTHSSSDDSVVAEFHQGCMEGCASGSYCEGFCGCSRDLVASDASLRERIANGDEAEGERLAAEVFVPNCGEEMLSGTFVEGCAGGCVQEGGVEEACVNLCGCAYGKLREAHPGASGLGEIFGMLSRGETDEAAAAAQACAQQ